MKTKTSLTNSMARSPLPQGLFLTALVLACFALSPTARAGRGLALRFSRLADWLLSLPLPVLLAMTAAVTRRRQKFTVASFEQVWLPELHTR